jgi:hypothetical protein
VCDGPNTYDPESGVCARCQDVIDDDPAPASRETATAQEATVSDGIVLEEIRAIRKCISDNWCQGLETTEDQIDDWAKKLDAVIAALSVAPKSKGAGGELTGAQWSAGSRAFLEMYDRVRHADTTQHAQTQADTAAQFIYDAIIAAESEAGKTREGGK